MRPLHVMVAGATGAVGREMLAVLERRRFPIERLVLAASSDSDGKVIAFNGADHTVRAMASELFDGIDVAFFAMGATLSIVLAPIAQARGAVVIDNSSAYRWRDEVPIIVPEVNSAAAAGHHGIIANPNCSTAILLLALAPLHRLAVAKRVVAATYQAASGVGARGMDELVAGTRAHLEGRPEKPAAFEREIAFNVLPFIGEPDSDGNTGEELKMQHECRRILGSNDLRVVCTAVRVPVMRTHAIAATVFFERYIDLGEARAALRAAPGVRLYEFRYDLPIPTSRDVASRDDVVVCRVKRALDDQHALSFFVLGDQLLKGAALNAVQIAELIFASES